MAPSDDVSKPLRADSGIHRLYRDQGFAQRVARSKMFDVAYFATTVVLFVVLGMAADMGPASGAWSAVGLAFTVAFALNVAVRFCAFREKRDAFRDGLFCLDSALTGLLLVELLLEHATTVSGLRLARLLRLLQLFRAVPLAHAVTPLRVLQGVVDSVFRHAPWGVLYITFYIYAWALVFRSVADRDGEADTALDAQLEFYFGTVAESMQTLFVHGVLLSDVHDVARVLRETSAAALLAFDAFVVTNFLLMLTLAACILGHVLRETWARAAAAAGDTEAREDKGAAVSVGPGSAEAQVADMAARLLRMEGLLAELAASSKGHQSLV